MTERPIEELAAIAVDCAYHVHRRLGPGLLESVYETVLNASLRKAGLVVARQVPVSFTFDEMNFSDAFRIDLLVDGRLIIEIKSTETIAKVHGKQLLTYLRLTEQPLGLLVNFGAATFRDGVKRVVNNHTDYAASQLRVNQNESPTSSQNEGWNDFLWRLPADEDFISPADLPSDNLPALNEMRSNEPSP